MLKAIRRSFWHYTPYWHMALKTPYEALCGVRYGFPPCCIAHYCLDHLLCRLSAKRRGIVFKRPPLKWDDRDGCYVPCFRCRRTAQSEGAWRHLDG